MNENTREIVEIIGKFQEAEDIWEILDIAGDEINGKKQNVQNTALITALGMMLKEEIEKVSSSETYVMTDVYDWDDEDIEEWMMQFNE